MPRLSVLKFVLTLTLTVPSFGSPLIVHEWGTFTSVAGRNGQSVSWAPLQASADLPCFVHRLGAGYAKYVPGLVRMETPVDYFYSPIPMKVSVHVDFPTGRITEWYPNAINPNPNNHSIDWTNLSIMPGTQPQLPVTKGASRYFAARATDSTPLQAGDESEKFLFYRGMADFKTPLEPVIEGNGVELYNNSAAPIPLAILFENQKGRVGYRIARNVTDSSLLDAPELNASLDRLRGELTTALVQAGLYPKEAAAMVETWQDSWFEEGMRIIYLMPRTSVDAVLPLKVTPVKEIQRVFVGRVEMLSPWTERTIRTAMESNDRKTLDKFGRFLMPFLAQIKAKGGLKEATLATSYVQQADARLNSAPCVQ
jgi:hypothetical protein